MSAERFHAFALISITLLLGFLGYQVMRPFLTPLAWAGVLSILFYPLYSYLAKRVRWKSLAAFVSLVIILVIILGPFSYLTFLLAKELSDVSGYISGGGLEKLQGVLDDPRLYWLSDTLGGFFTDGNGNIRDLLAETVSSMGRKLTGKITAGAKNVLTAGLNFVFMSLSIFFFLRDGPGLLKNLRDYLPFPAHQRERLERQVYDMIVSTIFGGVVVALVQGLMGGVAFFFLGIGSPVLWGAALSIMSFVPMLGAFSVWGPLTLYLFMEGAVAKGIILLIVGVFGISLVDNVLKPLIIGNRTKMPTLLIFFSVIGGIKLFGLIGLIMGPMSVALFISMLGIFRNIEGGTDAEQGRT